MASRAVPVPGPMADPGTPAAMADQAAMADPGTPAAMAIQGARAAMAEQVFHILGFHILYFQTVYSIVTSQLYSFTYTSQHYPFLYSTVSMIQNHVTHTVGTVWSRNLKIYLFSSRNVLIIDATV